MSGRFSFMGFFFKFFKFFTCVKLRVCFFFFCLAFGRRVGAPRRGVWRYSMRNRAGQGGVDVCMSD